MEQQIDPNLVAKKKEAWQIGLAVFILAPGPDPR